MYRLLNQALASGLARVVSLCLELNPDQYLGLMDMRGWCLGVACRDIGASIRWINSAYWVSGMSKSVVWEEEACGSKTKAKGRECSIGKENGRTRRLDWRDQELMLDDRD